MSTAQHTKLAAILGMLGSAHAGERDNAGLQAERIRRELGVTWAELLVVPREQASEMVERPTAQSTDFGYRSNYEPRKYEPSAAQIAQALILAKRDDGVSLGELNRIFCWQTGWPKRLGRIATEQGYRYSLTFPTFNNPTIHLRRS